MIFISESNESKKNVISDQIIRLMTLWQIDKLTQKKLVPQKHLFSPAAIEFIDRGLPHHQYAISFV